MSKEFAKQEPTEIQVALIEIVKRKDIDPERLEKFLDLQIRMENRQAAVEFHKALSGFQADCPIITKNKKVNFTSKSGNTTKYNYSPLDEIIHIIKPHLKSWGLSYSFNIKKTEDKNEHELVTKISHRGGHSEEFSLFFNPQHDDTRMNQAQRAKSSITFAKRAGLENALGIVTAEEDDDAARLTDTDITQSQIEAIKTLLIETKSDEAKFMSFIGVTAIEDMSGADAKKAIHALKQKRGK